MKRMIRALLTGGCIAAAAGCLPARAQPSLPTPLRIGFLTDVSGPHTSDDGLDSVKAARMAVADAGGSVLGRPVEIVVGDHLNKADVGSTIARRWIDTDGVDVIMDVNNSAVALAVSDIVRQRRKILLVTSAASSELTGKSCSPYTVHWLPDTWSLAHNAAAAVAAEGLNNWYMLVSDYAFGRALEAGAAEAVADARGKVVGVSRYPFGTTDFSSYLLQAQASGAQLLGLANAAEELVNSVKQVHEFDIKLRPVAFLLYLMDIDAVGQDELSGLRFVDAFYWDVNEKSRAWSKRFMDAAGHMPTTPQADAYQAVAHYLLAVAAAGTTDSDAVMAKMKAMPIDDLTGTRGYVRVDGRVIRDMMLFEVKPSKGASSHWDMLSVLRTIPGDEAYRPLKDGGCPFIKG